MKDGTKITWDEFKEHCSKDNGIAPTEEQREQAIEYANDTCVGMRTVCNARGFYNPTTGEFSNWHFSGGNHGVG